MCYLRDAAVAAGIVAREWDDADPFEERVVRLPPARPYRPGAFYERELPCLAAVLSLLCRPIGSVVIDGYVVLDENGRPGLGAHLHVLLGGTIPVVGVAKTAFRGSAFAAPVYRGASLRPLFVTAAGVPTCAAACLVGGMHGVSRIPTLIARTDRLARGSVPNGVPEDGEASIRRASPSPSNRLNGRPKSIR